jgi:hypothetical protein
MTSKTFLCIAAHLLMMCSAPVIAHAQSLAGAPSITGFAGLGGGSGTRILTGVEFRTAELGRVQPLVGASYWWQPTAGCDAVVGAPCYQDAFALEAGASVRLGPSTSAWRPFLAARVGGLFYGDLDSGVWNPNFGAGLVWSGKSRIGFRAEARYHALFGSDNSTPYAPPTADVISLQGGIEIRF